MIEKENENLVLSDSGISLEDLFVKDESISDIFDDFYPEYCQCLKCYVDKPTEFFNYRYFADGVNRGICKQCEPKTSQATLDAIRGFKN